MAKNPSIGSVACPLTGCLETCSVHRFAHAAAIDAKRRFAGKLYCICPMHGRLGMDATPAMQDYILKSAKMFNPDELVAAADPVEPAAPPARAVEPAKPAAAPAAARAPAPVAPARKPWGTVLDD